MGAGRGPGAVGPAGGRAGFATPLRPREAGGRPSPAARRFGYLVAAGINLALLFLIHVRPGWRVLPFLTEATTEVLPLVNLQLCTAVAINLIWIAVDPRWLRALGELATAVVGLAATARVLEVFPFAFDPAGVPWESLVRVLLWVGIVGSVIAVLVNVARLIRAMAAGPER